MAESRVESGIFGIHGSVFWFLSSPQIYGGFAHLSFPRWASGVYGHPRGTTPGTHGALRIGKIAEFRIESEIPGIPGPAFCLLSSPPIYGVFAYLALPLWGLGVNAQPRGASPGVPHGTQRTATDRQNGGITATFRNFTGP